LGTLKKVCKNRRRNYTLEAHLEERSVEAREVVSSILTVGTLFDTFKKCVIIIELLKFGNLKVKHYALVSQSAEEADLKSVQCGFEPHLGHLKDMKPFGNGARHVCVLVQVATVRFESSISFKL
jgi:hypothetical protein